MKRVFLDTNVVLDLLQERAPFWDEAERIFTQAYYGQYELFVSTTTYTTAAYVLRRLPVQTVKSLLQNLRSITHVAPSTGIAIDKALASEFEDIEDAVQACSAQAAGADCIVTRNAKDFGHADIPVYTPAEFLRTIHPTP